MSDTDPPLRTDEQMEWIRERFKPDGLQRLARADRDYADSHGYYLPDVAALAYENGRERDALVGRLQALEAALEKIAALPGKGAAGTGAAGWLLTLESPEIARAALRKEGTPQ